MRAPTAISARPTPIIKRSNGEKFAICSFAFVTKSVVKFTGNSIIECGFEGKTHYCDSIPRYFIFIMNKRSWFAIPNAKNVPAIVAIRGKKATIALVTKSV